jgi:glycosyltransferase involved in cell wall biosynthesis
MSENAKVSVIIIFFNTEKYLGEAIASVISQTYEHWEILLVDDGSTDSSTEIAQHYARLRPGQIQYLCHPGHANRGKGASRNLGIRHAKGDYLAFLDSDDVWLPHKLSEQVPVFDKYAAAGMVYGQTLYWYSWAQDSSDRRKDYIPWLGVPVDTLIQPPNLLPLYLRGKASIPCPCSILVRQAVIKEVGGFDTEFLGVNNIYEDQAFYAKLCLKTPMVVIDRCWDRYRQHPQASMAVAWRTGTEAQARTYYLMWLEKYLNEHAVQDRKVWLALKRELLLVQHPKWMPVGVARGVRWIKKWMMRIEEHLLPDHLSDLIWLQDQEKKSP